MNEPTVINAPLDCPLEDIFRGTVAVMGNLDGVHRGHQALIDEARKLAVIMSKPLAAITFEPHPRYAFRPETENFLLTTLHKKIDLLGQQGIETVFLLPFSRRLSMLEPAEFVNDILGNILGLSGIAVGADFQFGRKRAGTAQMLDELARKAGIEPMIVKPVAEKGEIVKFSSTDAREAIQEGRPEDTARILGRPWSVTGIVEKGKQLGRTLDFPTANIRLGDLIEPAKGVYAVKVHLNGETHNGVANFGSRPTVDGEGVLLEVYIFDFNGNIYGETLEVELHHFIRPEKKFDGLDALKAQISEDSGAARRLLTQ
ncbi:bifunctional riboflavin kinase/FAD synthetase [Aquisalinus flavus]|nr:bifunctional riboflavin kinase/FAD synthetase [Aquisalinus flavus]MBD0428093.1 bifunctional riboflavin kinase/FAD synthetase [Aquisalinus flavus]